MALVLHGDELAVGHPWRVLERLQRSGRPFPVIVITAQHDAREAAVARRADRVLIKPLTLDVLLEAVHAIVS